MSTLIVVPLDLGTAQHAGARGAAWRYVERTLMLGVPWPMVGQPLAGEWCKAEAVRAGIEHAASYGADPDVLVVHDADVLVDLAELRRCVDHVREHGGWAVPHRLVYRLTKGATDELIEHDRLGVYFERYPYEGFPGGGVTVVHADTYRDVPLDPRFVGWGGEDIAWGRALTLLHGEPLRAETPLWHLWHEHASPATQQRPARVESQVLLRAYRTKRVDRMRALVDGSRAAR